MGTFPLVENEVTMLASEMLAGYARNPGDFPHADAAALQAALDAFTAADLYLVERKAKMHIAATAKRKRFAALKAVMRTQLTQSEADTAQNPLKLAEIGWSARAKRKHPRAPGEVLNAAGNADAHGVLHLHWRNPERGSGGRVDTYIIERRGQDERGVLSDWELAAVSLKKRIALAGEPRGQRLEYRIHAANHAGAGPPSNTVTVIL